MVRGILFALAMAGLHFAVAAVSLDGVWRLSYRHQQQGGEWRQIPAEVPGEVQLALVAAGLASDPQVGTNVYSHLEYEQYEWKYERDFAGLDHAEGERIELRFGGVDTRAEYFLNGKRLGRSENMFVPVVFDVTDILQPTNRLTVNLRSILDSPSLGLLGRNRIGGSDFEYLRKAQHAVGWDIMPRLATAGIWKSVELVKTPPVRLEEFAFATRKIDLAERTAEFLIAYRVKAPWRHLHQAKLRYTLSRRGRNVMRAERMWHYQQTRDNFNLKQVDFWWPREAGEAALYDLRVEFVDGAGRTLAADERRVGIRTIHLEREDWKSEAEPGTFRFVVNGRPIYMHGCDTTPMDAFHSRDVHHVRRCMEMLVDLNCNMIRSWGGGVYEDEEFFRLCDENGICVWQDFALGNIYPSQRDDFARALESEAIAIVTRLRAHPSLALWCGNNEIDRIMSGNWGEMAPNPELERTSREILPRVLREFDPFTSYLPSSPVWNERMTRAAAKGQVFGEKLSQDHLWGPRARYFKHPYWTNSVTTFVSETGVHGCPNYESLKRMMSPSGLYPWPDRADKTKFNAEWNCKAVCSYPDQNLDGRNALMTAQVKAYFGAVPDDLAEFAELSQIYQAEALKCWAGTYRCRQGRTWGMLWWNLRDGWPIISDGLVDFYYGRKKAYDALKLVNQPQYVQLCDGLIRGLYAVNGRLSPVKGRVKASDVDSGKVFFDAQVELKANSSRRLMPSPELPGQGAMVIEYDFEGVALRNVCIYGEPPFAASQIRKWLENSKF